MLLLKILDEVNLVKGEPYCLAYSASVENVHIMFHQFTFAGAPKTKQKHGFALSQVVQEFSQ